MTIPLHNKNLNDVALRVRRHAIALSSRGSCFLGSALSVADVLVALYGSVFRLDPKAPDDPQRDKLILSKGHAVPALFGVLVESGVLEESILEQHLQPGSNVYWHPNDLLPGIDACTGSLGQGMSVGCGLAVGAKLDHSTERVFVIVGDGETNEGVVWETALFASAQALDNFFVIIDRNHIQANMRTEDLLPMEPIDSKWAAFGWNVIHVDGHAMEDLTRTFSDMVSVKGKPTVIIADTLRGKGIPSIENRPDKWIVKTTPEEAMVLVNELESNYDSI